MIDPSRPAYSSTPVSRHRPRFHYVPAVAGTDPCVSIVTPFFNTSSMFHETAASVFGQSLQQWEWIIVNDASTDAASRALLDDYRSRDVRITVIDLPVNRGPSAARNTGVRAARTPFVAFLDSDDLLEPTALEKWFWHLATFPEHSFVKGFVVGFGAQEYLWRRGFHEGEAFLEENLVNTSSMIRRDVFTAVGGFDESMQDGLEDWDFWLKCAAAGYWGDTVPEYLDWYRRRPDHTDRWERLGPAHCTAFAERVHERYPHLSQGRFPRITITDTPYATVREDSPARNLLAKLGMRMLIIIPWMTMGGADKFNLDAARELMRRGWEITFATTVEGDQSWLPEFGRITPDLFPLPNFLRLDDYPRFLSYLISSRQVNVVMVSHSEMGYRLLPWLRAHHPDVTFIDYCHMEEEAWNNGGHPRMGVQFQEQIDLNIVSSGHLQQWMVGRGGEEERIAVCTTNVDTDYWRPDPDLRSAGRRDWGVAEDLPVILYPCRITDQKQPRVFMETLRAVQREQASFLALVAGDGPDLPAMKRAAVDFGLSGAVKFLGAVSSVRVHELMAAADILFLPSKWEGIALTVYEAMASGMAVVGAAVGGQAELVVPGTGILVAPATLEAEVQAYAGHLVALLRDPAALARLKEAGRDRVAREFRIEQMGDRLDALCREACRLHGEHPRPSIPPGLARSTALEALELHRNRYQRWWQAALTNVTAAMLREALASVTGGRHQDAITLLRTMKKLFIDTKDTARITMIDTQIAHIAAAKSAPSPAAGTVLEPSDPLVSVVIPCYRQSEYLAEAMESVLAQTYAHWELIVVNDGSPDDTSAVVHDFQRRHPGHVIRLIEQENTGLPAARNAGIAASKGEFCVPLDADDRIAPTFIARCLDEMREQPQVGFVYSHMQRFGVVNDVFELPPFDAQTIVHRDNTASICALLRKVMWHEVGGYNETMREGYEDWDFWVGCIEQGWTGVRVPEPLFAYRIKPQGMLREANTKRLYLIARIVQNHPSLYERRTLAWAEETIRTNEHQRDGSVSTQTRHLRITYLIHNLLGVTGGNQTLLAQANALAARGHEVTIVTYSEPPSWITLAPRIIRVHPGMPMAQAVPPSDVVIATYFLNALELPAVDAPVKLYVAQGDQFAFTNGVESAQAVRMHKMSVASYRLQGVTVVANSQVLARRIMAMAERKVDGILPVCVDQRVFHPVEREVPVQPPRILIVGPDTAGTALEPLAFKGIGDIRAALEILTAGGVAFTAVRISNTPPEIFREYPCEFHQAPDDARKTALYGTADLLVYASHYDSCPRPPLEAMAAGIPVVCTATEGAQEYCVDGRNALLVPVGSPREIAEAITRLLGDAALRAALVAGGAATAAERPVEREWNELETLVNTLVTHAGAAPETDPPARPALTIIALMSGRDVPRAEEFVAALRSGQEQTHEIILVDLHAGDEVRQWIMGQDGRDGVTAVRAAEGDTAAHACNLALRLARGAQICIVRDGYRLPARWAALLASALGENPNIGLVAPVVVERRSLDALQVTQEGFGQKFAGRRFAMESVPEACLMFPASLLGWAGVMHDAADHAQTEPAGFVYRTLLAGFETVAAGDVVFVRDGEDDGERIRDTCVPFHTAAAPPANAGDPMERLTRAVLVALDEARALEYAGRVDEAASRLRREIERFPESPKLHTALAWLLLRARRFEDVSTLIGDTPDSVKRDPVWLHIAGFAMEGIGELAVARQCAEKSLSLGEHSAPALLLLGMIALDEGDAGTAGEFVERAVAADPAYAEAHAQRGALQWAAGDKGGARISLERAFVLRPTTTEIIDGFCQSRDGGQEHDGAQALVQEALQHFPRHKRLAYWNIALLTALDRKAEAARKAARTLGTFGVDQDLLDAAVALRSEEGPLSTAGGRGITLCMIVKNEEEVLAGCLASVLAIVDEIIVVDTGSTDRSARIATAMGARVIAHPWADDYAEARNAGLAAAHGAWILVLDADEVIAPQDGAQLLRLAAAHAGAGAGIVFTTRNYVRAMDLQGWQKNDGRYAEEAGTGWIGSDKVRLFPNRPDIRFRHPLHEVVEDSLQKAGVPLVRTGVPVHHYGRLDEERTRRKAEQYAVLGRKKLQEGTLTDARALLELAAQEQELGNHDAAVPLWQRFLELQPAHARAELGLGVSLYALERWADARAMLATATVHDPGLREAPVKLSLAELMCGNVAGAMNVLREFTHRTPDYLFGQLAFAAALACDGHPAEAASLVHALEQQQIRADAFFTNLSRDLRRAGMERFAECVTAIIDEKEQIPV